MRCFSRINARSKIRPPRQDRTMPFNSSQTHRSRYGKQIKIVVTNYKETISLRMTGCPRLRNSLWFPELRVGDEVGYVHLESLTDLLASGRKTMMQPYQDTVGLNVTLCTGPVINTFTTGYISRTTTWAKSALDEKVQGKICSAVITAPHKNSTLER